MKVVVKSINQKVFEIELKASSTVHDVKNRLNEQHAIGSPELLKLFFQGKILGDDETLNGSVSYSEDKFMVVTVSKPKAPAAASPAASAVSARAPDVAQPVPSAGAASPAPAPASVAAPSTIPFGGLSAGSSDCSVGESGCGAAGSHPDLHPELLQRIERSDPELTDLNYDWFSHYMESPHDINLDEVGCRVLARSLALNTCITELGLPSMRIGTVGASLLFPAITHLTTMTDLDLSYSDLQPIGAVHLCIALAQLTALTRLNLWKVRLQSSGASHLCCALLHLMAMTELNLCNNELTADDSARICAAAAAAGMTRLKNLVFRENPSPEHEFSASDVVDCGSWKQLKLPQPPKDIVRKCEENNWSFADLVSFVLSIDQVVWRGSALQCLVAWRESAVLPPPCPRVDDPDDGDELQSPVLQSPNANHIEGTNIEDTPSTLDRWSGWSIPNITVLPCILACFKWFVLAHLSSCHHPLPKPLKMHFPYRDFDASGGLCPRERVRLGSCGFTAMLLHRLCSQLRPSHRFVFKLRACVTCRVYSWQPNSRMETAFLLGIQENGVGYDELEFLERMNERDRVRLLTSSTCRKILTRHRLDPVNDVNHRSLECDVIPGPVVCDLAGDFMRSLWLDMDGGEFYSWHEEWQYLWQRGIRMIAQACPLALEKFVRTHCVFTLCECLLSKFSDMCDNDHDEFSFEFYANQSNNFFTELCFMLADVFDLVVALDVTPIFKTCSLQLMEILNPHWHRIPDNRCFSLRKFRCDLETIGSSPSTDFSSPPASTTMTAFPIDQDTHRRCTAIVEHVRETQTKHSQPADTASLQCCSTQSPPAKKVRAEAPIFVYMQRIANMMSDQLALDCVQLRVEGSSALLAKELTCSPTDTVERVLRSACDEFAISSADWRIYKDKDRSHELPLEKTLESCSISGYFTLYLG